MAFVGSLNTRVKDQISLLSIERGMVSQSLNILAGQCREPHYLYLRINRRTGSSGSGSLTKVRQTVCVFKKRKSNTQYVQKSKKTKEESLFPNIPHLGLKRELVVFLSVFCLVFPSEKNFRWLQKAQHFPLFLKTFLVMRQYSSAEENLLQEAFSGRWMAGVSVCVCM